MDAPRSTAARWGLAIALGLMAAASLIPFLTGWKVLVDLPPLHAEWDPRVGLGTVPALVLAVLAIRFAVDLGQRLPWRVLLLVAIAASAEWMIALALVDGVDGLGAILDRSSEYLGTARSVTDVSATLHEYISRIPLHADNHWSVHVAGHPPGALLFFVGLVRLGLGGATSAGLVVIAIAATTPAAVLITLRRLGAETEARLAAPFLVFGSAAIWMAVSADAMFGAVAAWGLCCLAIAATAARVPVRLAASAAAGLLLGYCVMLSYGLPLLAVLAVAILVLGRNWRPLLLAVPAALAVVLAFAAAGFAWWDAYPVLVTRYYDGIASRRPYGYWVWANLAALAVAAGPIVGASIAVALSRVRGLRDVGAGDRAIIMLTTAAALSILLADVSGMSRAEVERIWLPFVPWLLLGTALLPDRWRRFGLIGQLVLGLLVQHLLATSW
ncbi:glycosyltransferase family 39 protein [soil metagenome]